MSFEVGALAKRPYQGELRGLSSCQVAIQGEPCVTQVLGQGDLVIASSWVELFARGQTLCSPGGPCVMQGSGQGDLIIASSWVELFARGQTSCSPGGPYHSELEG